MKGKLIVIEGTDCSGKETQSVKLYDKLKAEGIPVYKTSFPMYDTPTGKIVGGPYLGKDYITDCWFNEGAVNVEPKVASLYYAADRRYNLPKINKLLDNGINVILDRYVYSNMAHQGGKILDLKDRMNMYAWLDVLEFKLLELPTPDIALFLHMPYENALDLRKNRNEKPDQHEANKNHLCQAENAYLELARTYKWKTIECVENDNIKTINQIGFEVQDYVLNECQPKSVDTK
jgi:dTMP kinase